MAISITWAFNRLLKSGEKVTNSLLNQVLTSLTAAVSGVVGNADLSATAVKSNVTVPDDFWYAAATLVGDTYAGVYNSGLTAWKAGLLLAFKADAANTGTAKLNFGAGAKDIRKFNGMDLQAGDIPAGHIVCVRYDGTVCRLLTVTGKPPYYEAGSTGGTANALTITLTPSTVALADIAGVPIIAKIATGANTDVVTLQVNALTAKPLRKWNNAVLEAADIAGNGQRIVAVYDAVLDTFVLLSAPALPQPVAVLANALNLVVRSGSPQASRVTVEADEVVLKNSAGKPLLMGPVAVNIDLNGASTGAGALDTGTEAISTWYYVWLIYNPTTANLAGLFSVSATAPTLPSGYTFKALVGVVRNNSAGDFVFFRSCGREYCVSTQTAYASGAGTSGVNTLLDLSSVVPPNAKVVSGVIASTAGAPLRAEVCGDATQSLGSTFLNGTNAAAGPDGISTASGCFRLVIKDPSTMYWKTSAAGNHVIYVVGYVI